MEYITIEKCVSISQPFASLIARGYKQYETRKWAAYDSVIGQRIGIASTSAVRKDWRAHYNNSEFQKFYRQRGEPELKYLPCGVLTCTAIVAEVVQMTEEFIVTISDEEKAYGNWWPGLFAWRLTDIILPTTSIRVLGKERIYNWVGGEIPIVSQTSKTIS